MFKKLGIKSKNIALLFSSALISGLLFFIPIFALYLEESLFSVTNVALIFAIEAIAYAALEMPTGAIADLFGRKKTIIAASIMHILAVVFLFIGGNMFMFILYALFNAFAMSLNSGTNSAFIYDTLKEEKKEHHYKKVVGTFHALWPIGASIGSIIGGYLAKVSLSLPILITFIPLTISLVIVFFLKEPKYEKEDHKNVWKHMIDSIMLIKKNKQLMILMIGGLIWMALGESQHLLGPLFLEFKGVPIEYFGWITALVFGLSSVGHYFSHFVSERMGDKRTLLFSVWFTPFLGILATYITGYWLILVFVIPSVFYGLRRPVIDNMLNKEVSSSKRATVLSASSFMGQLGVGLVAPLIGYFAELYTINIAYRISAVLLLVVPVLYLWLKE